jgi:hypothetical protein
MAVWGHINTSMRTPFCAKSAVLAHTDGHVTHQKHEAFSY